MKKILLSLMTLMLMALAASLISCGSDSDEPEETGILGTWSCDHPGPEANVFIVQFKSDGSFVTAGIFNVPLGNDTITSKGTGHGTYTINGDKLILSSSIGKTEYTYKIKGTSMTVTHKLEAYVLPSTTYTRVSDSTINQYMNYK